MQPKKRFAYSFPRNRRCNITNASSSKIHIQRRTSRSSNTTYAESKHISSSYSGIIAIIMQNDTPLHTTLPSLPLSDRDIIRFLAMACDISVRLEAGDLEVWTRRKGCQRLELVDGWGHIVHDQSQYDRPTDSDQ